MEVKLTFRGYPAKRAQSALGPFWQVLGHECTITFHRKAWKQLLIYAIIAVNVCQWRPLWQACGIAFTGAKYLTYSILSWCHEIDVSDWNYTCAWNNHLCIDLLWCTDNRNNKINSQQCKVSCTTQVVPQIVSSWLLMQGMGTCIASINTINPDLGHSNHISSAVITWKKKK